MHLFSVEPGKPNFVTNKVVHGEVVRLDANSNNWLEGKIVYIENADPGFDWIFNHGIAGLITCFGGAASHMAIRAAEFALPSAIGCGDAIAKDVSKAKRIELNCRDKYIRVLQ